MGRRAFRLLALHRVTCAQNRRFWRLPRSMTVFAPFGGLRKQVFQNAHILRVSVARIQVPNGRYRQLPGERCRNFICGLPTEAKVAAVGPERTVELDLCCIATFPEADIRLAVQRSHGQDLSPEGRCRRSRGFTMTCPGLSRQNDGGSGHSQQHARTTGLGPRMTGGFSMVTQALRLRSTLSVPIFPASLL